MPFITRREFFLAAISPFVAPIAANALVFKGVDYMPISQLARLCGMRYRTNIVGKSQSVYSKTTKLTFEVHSKCMELNGLSVWLLFPVAMQKNMLYIAKQDYIKTIAPILYPQKNGTAGNLFHIVIDAGHGGKDNGAENRKLGIKEKAISFDIAKRLAVELKKNGYRVTFTRSDDTFKELPYRPAYANRQRANLFLSIHCNAASPSVSGIETFSLTPRWAPSTTSAKLTSSDKIAYAGNANDGWNQLIAYYIQRAMRASTLAADRGVKRARFAVLRDLKMPGALIECGFISNTAEGKKLATAAYRQKIATAIASAVYTYQRTLKRVKNG